MRPYTDYCQVYVGGTHHSGGIMTRVQQHWRGTQSLDRLVWGGVETSIISIDSFRALDTTRIYAVKPRAPSTARTSCWTASRRSSR